jgi:hypothetical protein
VTLLEVSPSGLCPFLALLLKRNALIRLVRLSNELMTLMVSTRLFDL